MKHVPTIRSYYLRNAFSVDKLKKGISEIVQKLRSHTQHFDTVVFRGVSGALIGPALAMRLNKQMLIVRKKDQNHSCLEVEGNIATKKYIIIDDFIDSGDTIRCIKNTVTKETEESTGKAAECYAMVTYLDSRIEKYVKEQIEQILGEEVKYIRHTLK